MSMELTIEEDLWSKLDKMAIISCTRPRGSGGLLLNDATFILSQIQSTYSSFWPTYVEQRMEQIPPHWSIKKLS